MSAIAGIYYRDQHLVDHELLQRMVDNLAHHGPDGVGVWHDHEIGLGHCLLWTTPESVYERFPLRSQLGNLVLVSDARIDNRDELLSTLNLIDHPAEKITDGQLLLSAYEKWGCNCPNQLLGDFSFAIWDENRRTLFCARDHFGVKPLYYYASDRIFAFASEIKALLCLPEVPRQLNEIRVAEHLILLDSDPKITFYRDIFRLPPACHLSVNAHSLKVYEYWSLESNRALSLGSNQEYANQFLDLFTEAVRCRLRSVSPVGAMLSGGLDSSSITCVARNLLAAEGSLPLHTFSAGFDIVSESDEQAFQSAVLAQGNVISHYLQGDSFGPLTNLEQVLWHQEEALTAGNLRLNWGLYQLARDHNVHVVLDGWDGDITVSHGYEYLRELARKGQWLTLASETRAYGQQLNLPWTPVLWRWVWEIRPTSQHVAVSHPCKAGLQNLSSSSDFPVPLPMECSSEARICRQG